MITGSNAWGEALLLPHFQFMTSAQSDEKEKQIWNECVCYMKNMRGEFGLGEVVVSKPISYVMNKCGVMDTWSGEVEHGSPCRYAHVWIYSVSWSAKHYGGDTGDEPELWSIQDTIRHEFGSCSWHKPDVKELYYIASIAGWMNSLQWRWKREKHCCPICAHLGQGWCSASATDKVTVFQTPMQRIHQQMRWVLGGTMAIYCCRNYLQSQHRRAYAGTSSIIDWHRPLVHCNLCYCV